MPLRVPNVTVRPGLSALPKAPFPPPELKNTLRKLPGATRISAEDWGSIQEISPATLSALAARLSFSTNSPDTTAHLLEQALTHASCHTTFTKYYPKTPLPPTNQNLASVGNGLLGLFASEWLHATYPHLPTRVAKAALSAYVGPRTLSEIAKEWGALPLMRWSITQKKKNENIPVLQSDALASFPRALIAVLAKYVSLTAAREFTHAHFLSRSVDLEPLLKFRAPKIALTDTVAKFGRERPIARLMKETGRHTNTPIFVVGIYSGVDKLGEGFGNSLKMAEFRAAEDSLNRVYLTQQSSDLYRLPTSTFPNSFTSTDGTPSADSLESHSNEYIPPQLGESEVLYASAGRQGRAPGPERRHLREEEFIV